MFNVKRLKRIEDLLAEANIIRASDIGDQGSKGGTDNQSDADYQKDIEAFDILMDSLLDKAINPEDFKDDGIKNGKQIIEKYLEYCQGRLHRISEKIKASISAGGSSQNEIKNLTELQFRIAKKITILEEIYSSFKERQDAEVRQIADDITKKIDEIQKLLADEYFEVIQIAGKKNFDLLQKIEKAQDSEAGTETAKEIVDTWTEVEEITSNLPPQNQAEIKRLKNTTYDKVKQKIGDGALETIIQNSNFGKEEADLIARIVRLNYRAFTSEEEIRKEFADLRSKLNSLRGDTKYRTSVSPETIKYLSDMIDAAEMSIYNKFKNKSISLKMAKGIHFDVDMKLKLYERVSIPVTGKQIADNSTIMRLRKGFDSLMDLLFGGMAGIPETPAALAWKEVGKRSSTVYSKTLNKIAKTAGRLIGGREGEMKADALSRLFIPDTSILDVKPKSSLFEDAVSPGLANQVPGSIGGMGDIVAPTKDSIGSGDRFSKEKSKSTKRKRVLEFNDFVSQFLK